MPKKSTIARAHKVLIRRYLLWLFKTTKESFERIERKTTQLVVDKYLLERMEHAKGLSAGNKNKYDALIKEFEAYITTKEKDELKLKFADAKGKILEPQYVHLKNKLEAVEDAIKHFLGEKELRRIHSLYEKEFTTRILQAREH